MTTQEIMELVFQESGEPSDLCPYTDPGDYTTFDITRAESVRLLRIVNMALRRIASWRLRSGRIVRYKALDGRTFVVFPDPPTGTVVSAGDTSLVIPQLGTDANDELNGWLVEITRGTGAGQVRLIVDSAVGGGNVTLENSVAWDTNPDDTSTFALYKGFASFLAARTLTVDNWHILLNPVTELHDVVRIRDVQTNVDLVLSQYGETFSASQVQSGVPTEFQRYGDQIWFDVAIAERRVYELLYTKNPTALATATQSPCLPEIFHQAIILWAVHEIQRMNQAFGPAYTTKRELEDFMEIAVQQGASELSMETTGIVAYG